MSVVEVPKKIRLTIYVPGENNRGSWPKLNVELSPALTACATYSSFIDTFLALLKEMKATYPSWLDGAKEDGTLFLFSEDPCIKRQPTDIKKEKDGTVKWNGNYWGGEDGACGGKDIKALKAYLQTAGGIEKPHLYLAKACPRCIAPTSTTLKILTARLLTHGVCDLKKGTHAGSLSLSPSFLHTRVLLYCQSRANRAVTVPSVKPCVRAPFCNHRNSIPSNSSNHCSIGVSFARCRCKRRCRCRCR